jgi:hypothetical protein
MSVCAKPRWFAAIEYDGRDAAPSCLFPKIGKPTYPHNL